VNNGSDSNIEAETDAYLARIRKTIADSRALVAQTELRIAETDRLLERQGLTREQVLAMHITEAQFEAANEELRRRGMDPLERWSAQDAPEPRPQEPDMEIEPSPGDDEIDRRRMKFGMMMKPFQI